MNCSFGCRLLYARRALAALLAGLPFPMAGRAGPIPGPIDTFGNSTADGWMIGDLLVRSPPVLGFTLPAVIPTGEPGPVTTSCS
jgi:hypothetical protein